MVKRISQAKTIHYHFVTGPDSWDSDVDITFVRPNKFSRSQKDYTSRTDGKWFLELDVGAVEHRPVKQEDYAKAVDAYTWAKGPKHDVFGKVEEISDGRVFWALSYRKPDGETGRVIVNPQTSLPVGISLDQPRRETFAVPTYQRASTILDKSAAEQRKLKSIYFVVRSRNEKGQLVGSRYVLLYPDGTAIQDDMPIYTWIKNKTQLTSQAKKVRASTLGLFGFERYAKAKPLKVEAECRLENAAGNQETFAWKIPLKDRNLFIGESGWLPQGFEFANRHSVRYEYLPR